VTLKLRVVER